jgi:RNA polymerase sigma factor (sigma-70 family)
MLFTAHYQDISDRELIESSLSGNKLALEKLIKKHQDYIYNVALKFFLNPDDALDATQEVLIKVITALQSFKGDSNFRTWLYRIVFNHFLNSPERKMEKLALKSNDYPIENIMENENAFSEQEIEEVRILCSSAMLMCLNREQRLLYIIGEIFGADHNIGAELFDISPANYRIKLHRAKSDLFNYVSGKCGLINPDNPCRCPKKTKVLVEQGIVDRNNLRFNTDYQHKIKDIVEEHKDTVSDNIKFELKDLFLNSPFQVKEELNKLLDNIVK